MKKSIINVIVLALLASIGFTQELVITEKFAEKSISKTLLKEQKTHPFCGTALAYEKNKDAMEYYANHPEQRSNFKKSPNGWGFNIGDTHNWWAGDYQVPSTCRGIGDDCYVFVADSLWHEGGYFAVVTQANVDDIVEKFSNTTANFPNEGIYDVDVETFGNPYDIDNDNRIIILILDIHTDNVGGYFAPINEYPDDPSGLRSNEAEMFYADYSGLNNSAYFFGLLAHEFQHMIHFNYDLNEITFVNEGLSMTAEYVCGYYEDYYYNLYQQNTNLYLFRWDDPSHEYFSANYARSALWTLYLYEQYPNDFLKMLVQEPEDGGDGINQALSTYGATRNWQEILEDWLIANYLQDVTVNPRWGYAYQNAIAPIPVAEHNTPNVSGNGSVARTSGQYVTFKTSIPDTITWTAGSNLNIKAIKIGNNTVVEDVPNGIPYIIKPNGETFLDVTFCIINNSPYTQFNYSYVAKGPDIPVVPGNYELFYEDGVPEGLLLFATGDSSAVFFSGIAGAKLDSIKVAFRRAGKIQMDISEFDGQTFMRGKNLYGPVQFNSLKETASVPYPVPYDNWVKVNLTNQDIDASNDFVVSFLIGSDPEAPGIMVSSEPDDGVRHSRTYVKDDDTWYPYGVSGTPGNIWNYLIRAYVSVGGGTVAIDQNGIVTIPDQFSLEQNYPNPFNPSTTFRFSTPNDGLVKFTVHDLLGRVIYSENRNLFAGNYSFTWNGQNQLDQQVVSGVYFLRMEAEGYSQTHKMLLLR